MFYTKVFEMCGYSAEEIDKERSRIERAIQILELGPDDFALAEERLPKQVDVTLEGVRKCLKLWWQELINLVLGKEEGKKFIYFTPPTVPTEPMEGIVASLIRNNRDDVIVASPDLLLCTVLGCLFDRNNPLVAVGEELGLAAGAAHCGLSQTWVAGMKKDIIPVPVLAVSSAYMCDQVPEAQELIAELFHHETVYIDRVYDTGWDEWPAVSQKQLEYMKGEFRRALDRCGEVIGIEITDEDIVEGRRRYLQAAIPYFDLRNFMTMDPPPFSAADMMPFFYMFLNVLRHKEPFMDACRTLAKELKERVKSGYGVVPKGSPSVFFPLVPNPDTTIVHIVESLGMAIPCFILMYPAKAEIEHKQRTATDPLGKIIESYMSKPWYTHNFYPLKQWIREMAENFKVDGILYFQTSVCRCNSAENPLALRKVLVEETNLPTILLEGDYHCTRVYGAEETRTRIETFAEVVRAHQAARLAAA